MDPTNAVVITNQTHVGPTLHVGSNNMADIFRLQIQMHSIVHEPTPVVCGTNVEDQLTLQIKNELVSPVCVFLYSMRAHFGTT